MMISYILVSLAFFSAFMIATGINLFVFDLVDDRRQQLRQKLADENRLRQAERARNTKGNHELYELTLEGFAVPDAKESLVERLRKFVTQAGIRTKLSEILLVAGGLAVIVGFGVWLGTGTPLLAIMSGAASFVIPFVVVHVLLIQRRNKLLAQLPDAYEMMARVLKAGQTITQAIRGVADEFSSPLGEEFAFCWEQQNLGLSPEASLRELAKRSGVLELKIFVVALMIHRQTGGNLSHLLLKLSSVIREREKIRGKIGALTAEGKFQAYILVALPFVIGGMFSIINPDYMEPLLRFPIIFVVAGLFMTAGIIWMRRIIDFDF